MENNSLREKFIDGGIPYDDLDKQMIPLIDVLNFHLNIKTKYCCYGHGGELSRRMYVMFDDHVDDQKLIDLLKYLTEDQIYIQGVTMNKWYRKVDQEIECNWIMKSALGWKTENPPGKEEWLNDLVDKLYKYNIKKGNE